LAVERMEEAVRFIARDKPEAARRWAMRLLDRVERLAAFPASGRVVPELGRSEVRELIHESHRVIYRIGKDAVRVLTVRHVAQLLDADELEE